MKKAYSKLKIKRHIRWHKKYNQAHDYATKDTRRAGYTWTEMYLIWNKRLKGGRILVDVEIAKLLSRSLQAIQLKRHKMKMEGW